MTGYRSNTASGLEEVSRLGAIPSDLELPPSGVIKNTKGQGERITLYDSPRPSGSLVPRGTENDWSKRSFSSRSTEIDRDAVRKRHSLRLKLNEVGALLDCLCKTVGVNPIEAGTYGESLRLACSDLWRLRSVRANDDWSQIVNILQGVLPQITWEQAGIDTVEALKEIHRFHLRPAAASRQDVKRVRSSLEGIGLDPWAPISQKDSGLV